ncbi:hypothetical protein OG921_03320 [Aldersonia sp. NBC_00410]|uniref:hypothetical protein n=1 Tax=Aldersonia sp. NBC_00410 TaxID=2975954 RepID=UPI002257BDB8|nr:hypothetical protein [Aldersonia sp. NBC_00410]MCX5042221.1 hypothetical protein [Aldersonia sp. NBC_00410]
MSAPAPTYDRHDWTVTTAADEVSLLTDDNMGGIELAGDLARGVHEYLHVNGLIGPVLELPGSEFREIHVVAGLAKAEMALAWLIEAGATVHRGGTAIPLPATESAAAGQWSSAPDRAMPAAVALAAAVRAVQARNARSATAHARSAAS